MKSGRRRQVTGRVDASGQESYPLSASQPCIRSTTAAHLFRLAHCLDVDRDAKAIFESRAKQSTHLASISAANIRNCHCRFLPLDEQSAIVAYLDRRDSASWMGWWRQRSACWGWWRRSGGRSSPAPSPVASTPAPPSATPASPGSARFQRIGDSSAAEVRSATVIDCKHRTVPCSIRGHPARQYPRGAVMGSGSHVGEDDD